jgi:hypothetical protein
LEWMKRLQQKLVIKTRCWKILQHNWEQEEVEIRSMIKHGEPYILETLLIRVTSVVFCGLWVVILCSMEENRITRKDSQYCMLKRGGLFSHHPVLFPFCD